MTKNKETLYFRVDMNNIVATGHIMRCLSIADAASDKGYESVFILADDTAVSLISSRGYDYIVLGSKWDDMDSEIDIISKLIACCNIRKIIIDSYYVTEKYLRAITILSETIYIDDINAFDYPVNKLICYANYYSKFEYDKSKYTNRVNMLGCKYVPLRSEFKKISERKISKNIRKLLIICGGSDNYKIIDNMLGKLSMCDQYDIVAICGRFNKDYDYINSKYINYNNIVIYKTVDNMIDYMLEADLAISAGGTSLYELCACGTPTITYSFADNQLDNVIQFEKDNLMPYLGDVRYDDIYKTIDDVIDRIRGFKHRKNISNKMQCLVDGFGSKRIIEAIEYSI
ncbi:MAG: UDP-2,4-diacetamido-2,4,6-trideoxy-beta-L-altropyranose hydrolase [Lachnospiraceae bacterium]|nr:UDP-2,4-diacetamido-2,4,6-trideoxy-beta-L-altropyranose hydrolase [Lachnospiraceae bacterium]